MQDAPDVRLSARVAQRQASGSAEPPTTAPWSAEAEIELRRKAEADRDYWKAEAGRLEERCRVLSAAADDQEGRVSFLERNSSLYYREVQVLRAKMRRWDPANWAELCVSMLKGKRGDPDSHDYTSDITSAPAFREELKAIHANRDEECRLWLESHALRPEKQLLVKNAHRISGRARWAGSTLFSSLITASATRRGAACAAGSSCVRTRVCVRLNSSPHAGCVNLKQQSCVLHVIRRLR